jgi:hypothetical protein
MWRGAATRGREGKHLPSAHVCPYLTVRIATKKNKRILVTYKELAREKIND